MGVEEEMASPIGSRGPIGGSPIGHNSLISVVRDWILALGVWDDSGQWIDTEVWID